MTLAEFKKALRSEKVQYGSTQAIRKLKQGTLKKIFISSDCYDRIKQDLKYYCKFQKVTIEELPMPSDELALLCKKNFPVTVVSY